MSEISNYALICYLLVPDRVILFTPIDHELLFLSLDDRRAGYKCHRADGVWGKMTANIISCFRRCPPKCHSLTLLLICQLKLDNSCDSHEHLDLNRIQFLCFKTTINTRFIHILFLSSLISCN